MAIKTITNNQPRNLLHWYELSEAEQAEFDNESDAETLTYIRYRGEVYRLDDFIVGHEDWDATLSTSAWSAIAIRYCDDNQRIIVAQLYW
jgi:hypothetical protein